MANLVSFFVNFIMFIAGALFGRYIEKKYSATIAQFIADFQNKGK